ncbi:MAG: putative spermidine/putrescine transport system ATP-binding protein [Solirubrobacteraceae bacterium]|jgi:putative spermidine/putrescine transport system ATP-binding protein|nr:putative spermidine/putrescine transport system ATP-binding protein [Solirubrobacteraceae bacterium]
MPEAMTAHASARASTPRAGAPADSPGATLSLRGVTKRYGDQVVVDGVSLDVRGGEFVTLLGPSGSGKTTTLNMIAGFADIDAGEILLDGRSIAELPPHRRNVGMVFQNYALFPHMTALENVAFPLKQARRPKAGKQEIRRRAMEALELAHMAPYAERYPRQLSGGQQQRVAVARAIVFNPRVLLMDEPLGALDKKLREALQLEIKRIHRELGITFIYVTHDQEEALVLSDRIAIFNEGRIVQLGTSAELYERPDTVFVADFIGDSNLLSGALSWRDGEHWLVADGVHFRVAVPGDYDGGEDVTVVIRPERVELAPADEVPSPDRNALAGRVEEVIYLGNTRRYVVALAPGGGRMLARAQVGGAAVEFAVGEEVRVTWPVQAAVVLARGEAER